MYIFDGLRGLRHSLFFVINFALLAVCFVISDVAWGDVAWGPKRLQN